MNIEISPKKYERRLNWYDAILYCQLLTIDDKSDWRISNIEELKNISTLQHDFNGSYWSIDEKDVESAKAWDFRFGWADFWDKNRLMYVRPVRTIEPS
jgi:hypothetical protein